MCKYLSVFVIFAVSVAAETNSGISISIDNIKPPAATLYIAIYAATDNSSWLDEPFLRLQKPVSDETFSITGINLPDGRYAARAFLDQNQNGRLDTDKSGKPLEPFAISIGNQRKKISPKFAESVFNISPEQRKLQMTLRYPRSNTRTSVNH